MNYGCNDKRYEKLLYAWELGLLDDADRKALELHLLDCNACFLRAEKFADAAELLRHSESIKTALASQASEEYPDDTTARRNVWPGLVRISLVAAAVLAILILRPWQLEFKSTQVAVAAANRLAVDDFRNLTAPDDPDRLGSIVAGLLITDLSESEYLQVVSGQRWQDASRLLETEADPVSGRSSPLEIARRVSARWLLTGEVSETHEVIHIKSQLIDVGTGVVTAAQEILGNKGDSVFALVDKLTQEVRADLSIPDELSVEVNRPVAEVTTKSREAYRYYLEGLEYTTRYYNREAIGAFEQAVSFDSTFAMAYYQLSVLKDQKLIARAMELSQHATWLEQHYIRAFDAEVGGRDAEMKEQLQQIITRFPDEKEVYFKLGQYYWRQIRLDSARAYLERAVEIDPMYRAAFNQLMYVFDEAGQFDRAIWAINKYISLAPGEANPFDSRGDLYAQNGKPIEAADSYVQALRVKPDFSTSAFKLAYMWIFTGEYARADSLLQSLEHASNVSTRASARFVRTLIPMYQGEFDSTLTAIETALLGDKQDSDSGEGSVLRASYFELRARIFAEKADFDQALRELDRAIETYRESRPHDSVTFGYLYAHYLSARGDFATAEAVHKRIVADSQANSETPCYQYWAAGGIELARGNAAEAVIQLERGTALTSVKGDFVGNFLLARAYLEDGQLGKAVPLFEKLESIYSVSRLVNTIDGVKLHYYLGIAYEESRWYDQAAQEYRQFLKIWSKADPGLNAVADARARLQRIENET